MGAQVRLDMVRVNEKTTQKALDSLQRLTLLRPAWILSAVMFDEGKQ